MPWVWRRGNARGGKFVPFGAVEEDVDRIAFEVAALDQDGARAHFANAGGGGAHVVAGCG